MSTESKFFIGIGVITLVLVIAGAIFFSRAKPKNSQQTSSFDKSALIEGAREIRGNAQAEVQIVEFADLQCPACQAAQPIVNQILNEYSQSVYFVFRHYPLSAHKNAKVAAKAAEAAGAQGKFFEFVDLVYANQKEWEQDSDASDDFKKYAQLLGLDVDKFGEDMKKDYANINEDYALGNRAGVSSTPTFFINGEKYPGVISLEKFKEIINVLSLSQGESTNSSSL